MVVVFVRDKDGPDPGQGETHASHPAFGLAAGKTRIDEHGFFLVTNIVTVAVAAGI
jgi:hypothetical protein